MQLALGFDRLRMLENSIEFKGAVRGTTISRRLKNIPPLIEFFLYDICCHLGHGLLLHGGPGQVDALGS